MLLGWRDVVEGIFEVQRRDGAGLVVENLIDELIYRVRSNAGTAVFGQMPRRSYVVTRLVPVGDEWLISGATSVFPARYRAELHRAAAEQAMRSPELGFRNPDKLARAWELQRADRDRFVRFFGSDLVVLRGEEVADRMRAFREFCHREITAELKGPVPAVAELGVDSELADAESVALVYDEEDGLGYYVEFGLVEKAFTDPSLLRRRLSARDVARASAVFRTLLRRPGFDWARDGESAVAGAQEAALRTAAPPVDECDRGAAAAPPPGGGVAGPVKTAARARSPTACHRHRVGTRAEHPSEWGDGARQVTPSRPPSSDDEDRAPPPARAGRDVGPI